MTNQERVVFEELLRAGMRVVRKLGKEIPIAELMVYSTEYTKAANAAEWILDPLRSATERGAIENEVWG